MWRSAYLPSHKSGSWRLYFGEFSRPSHCRKTSRQRINAFVRKWQVSDRHQPGPKSSKRFCRGFLGVQSSRFPRKRGITLIAFALFIGIQSTENTAFIMLWSDSLTSYFGGFLDCHTVDFQFVVERSSINTQYFGSFLFIPAERFEGANNRLTFDNRKWFPQGNATTS